MFFGTFLVQARDPRPPRSLASGSITANDPAVTRVVTLASYGACKERFIAPTDDYGFGRNRYGVRNISTVTDAQGRYALSFLRSHVGDLRPRSGSRGIGFGQVTLDQQGQTKTADVTLSRRARWWSPCRREWRSRGNAQLRVTRAQGSQAIRCSQLQAPTALRWSITSSSEASASVRTRGT